MADKSSAEEGGEGVLILPSWSDQLPPEWQWRRLDDVCAEIVDCPHSTPEIIEAGPYLMARTSDILSGIFRAEEARRVSERTYLQRVGRAEPTFGDLLYSREGTYFGFAAEVPPGVKVCLGQRMVLLRPATHKVNSTFLRYWLNSSLIQSYIHGHRDGTVAERLNIPTILRIPVCIPPLPYQEAIAHILRAFDEKIELNRRSNETLEGIARALFKSWFVDFDPVRANAKGRDLALPMHLADLFPNSFEQSDLGLIPKGWAAHSVYGIANVIYGAPFASSQFNAVGIGKPLVRIRDLADESPAVWTPELHPKGYIVKPGDIIVGMDGEFRAYLWGGAEAWLNQRVCVFVPKTGVSGAFVHNSITRLLADVEATETATTVIHLGKADIDRFMVVVPERPTLAAFNRLCQPLYDRIVVGKRESRALAALRDALLPKLVSGELRIRDAERIAAEAGL